MEQKPQDNKLNPESSIAEVKDSTMNNDTTTINNITKGRLSSEPIDIGISDAESFMSVNSNPVLDENEHFFRSNMLSEDSTSNYMFYSTRAMPTVNTDDVMFSNPAPGTPAAEALAGKNNQILKYIY